MASAGSDYNPQIAGNFVLEHAARHPSESDPVTLIWPIREETKASAPFSSMESCDFQLDFWAGYRSVMNEKD